MHLSIEEYGQKIKWPKTNTKLVENISNQWKKTLGIRQEPFTIDNQNYIRSSAVTGFVTIDKINIEIKPKFLNDIPESNTWRQVLWNILIFNNSNSIAILSESLISKAISKNSILDLIGWVFLNEIRQLKSGIPRSYITQENELKTLRGKLDIRKIISLAINPHGLHCIYDEYTDNIFVNQLFKWACTILSQNVESSHLSGLLNQELIFFKDITFNPFPSLEKTKRIKLPSQYKHAEALLTISILLLENHNVEYNFGNFKNFGFLWNSHEVYEDFLYKILKICISHFNNKNMILIKEKQTTLATSISNVNKIIQKPDYIIKENTNNIFILDAKYKYLEYDELTNKHKNPKKEDVNQMLVACFFEECKHGILIYPGNSKTGTKVHSFMVNHVGNPKYIHVLYINLEVMVDFKNYKILSKEIYDQLLIVQNM